MMAWQFAHDKPMARSMGEKQERKDAAKRSPVSA